MIVNRRTIVELEEDEIVALRVALTGAVNTAGAGAALLTLWGRLLAALGGPAQGTLLPATAVAPVPPLAHVGTLPPGVPDPAAIERHAAELLAGTKTLTLGDADPDPDGPAEAAALAQLRGDKVLRG